MNSLTFFNPLADLAVKVIPYLPELGTIAANQKQIPKKKRKQTIRQ